VDDMTPHDKHATLLVDEMKITPGYQYDISLKEVLGLCTYEEHTCGNRSCIHALWALHEMEVDDLSWSGSFTETAVTVVLTLPRAL
jgi:hypothetical protein